MVRQSTPGAEPTSQTAPSAARSNGVAGRSTGSVVWTANGGPPPLHGDRRRSPRPVSRPGLGGVATGAGGGLGPVVPGADAVAIGMETGGAIGDLGRWDGTSLATVVAERLAQDAVALERAWQRVAELERELALVRARLVAERGARRLTVRERLTGRRRPAQGPIEP